MISQNALHHAEKCRFCFMCRHLCPIQLQTGREINTPRAKGLLLSMVKRGTQEFDRDMAQTMYECLLCDACVNDCATGYQPPLYIREARTEAVIENLAPAEVMELIDNIMSSGNIYGVEKPSFAQTGKDVLVYLGEVATCQTQALANSFLQLLHLAGVQATVLDNEPASGAMLADLIGYVDEVSQQAKACAAAINQAKPKTVVVLDSYDAQIMKQKYPEWGFTIDAEVVTATSFIAQILQEGKLQTKPSGQIIAACHDDDRTARAFYEFAPIRTIAESAGFVLTEMFNTERLAKSCGSAVTLAYMPKLIKRVAAGRWDDLKRTAAKTMVTANPQAYLCLSQAIPEGYTLVDAYTALLNNL